MKPRPWFCSRGPKAVFCTHHGDCLCPRYPDGDRRTAAPVPADCPLHGPGAARTGHPYRQAVMK